jgi:hypothetical protein
LNSTNQCTIDMRLPGMPKGMTAQCTATSESPVSLCHRCVGHNCSCKTLKMP